MPGNRHVLPVPRDPGRLGHEPTHTLGQTDTCMKSEKSTNVDGDTTGRTVG
jgi:hypothetical protein